MRSTPLEQLRPETLSIGVGELVLAVRQLLRQPSNRRQQPSEQLLFHTAFGQHVHRAVVESCLRRGIYLATQSIMEGMIHTVYQQLGRRSGIPPDLPSDI